LVVAPDTGLTLGRDVRADAPLLVIGGPVRLAATVRGDVIVLGELFLRPGADVDGRAVAIGGGAYNSTLARVRGGVRGYREVEFTATPAGGGALTLDARVRRLAPESRLALAGTYGVRLPSYDRVNGLSLGFGPELALDTGRVRIEPRVTYRSQLGVVDPAVRAVAELTRRTRVELTAERGTFTNDAWARAELVNSVVFGGTGADARNYYRADRAELTVARRYEATDALVEPFVGGLVERSWSAGRDTTTSRPFTLVGRDDVRQGARRANPAVTGGRITSALVGARASREVGDASGRAEARVEQALAVSRADRFTRATLDVAVVRGARDARQLAVFAHGALVVGGAVPTQRYAYLGGGPTLPTLFLLSQGRHRGRLGGGALHRSRAARAPSGGWCAARLVPRDGRGGRREHPAVADAEPRGAGERRRAARRLRVRPHRGAPAARRSAWASVSAEHAGPTRLGAAGGQVGGGRRAVGLHRHQPGRLRAGLDLGRRPARRRVRLRIGRCRDHQRCDDRGAEQERDHAQRDPGGHLHVVAAQHLGADEGEHAGEPVSQQVESLDHAREHEEQRPQPEDGEDVGRVDQERVARDAEHAGDRVHREHQVRRLDEQRGRRRAASPASAPPPPASRPRARRSASRGTRASRG
jgi:hypothetical protein